jgi:hypothetical protein
MSEDFSQYDGSRTTRQILGNGAEQAARCGAPDEMTERLVRLAAMAMAKDAPEAFLAEAKARQAQLEETL